MIDRVRREPAHPVRVGLCDGVLACREASHQLRALPTQILVADGGGEGECAQIVTYKVAVDQAPLVGWRFPAAIWRGWIGEASLGTEGVEKPVNIELAQVFSIQILRFSEGRIGQEAHCREPKWLHRRTGIEGMAW